jgi:hypothetical protein
MRGDQYRQFRAVAGNCTRLGLLLAGLSTTVMAQAPPELSRAVQFYGHEQGGAESPTFRWALADLNDDGRDDAIVLLTGPKYCGADGCTMLVFRGTDQGFTLLSATAIVMAPIRVSANSADGWRSLIVYSKAKGDVVLKFSGTHYPANPSVQPKVDRVELEAAANAIQ